MNQVNQEAVEEQAPSQDKGLLANMREEVKAETPEDGDQPIAHKTEEDNTKKAERPDFVPEKFWDKDKGEVRQQEAFKSLGELEKKLSQGKHKAPEEYDYEVLDKNGWTKDDPVVEKFTVWSKENNISQENFDQLVKQVIEIAGQGTAQEEINSQEELKKLGNNGTAVIKQNLEWIDGKVQDGVFTKEEAEVMDTWGNTALGIKLISKIKNLTGDLAPLPLSDVSEIQESLVEFNDRMDSLMSDERYGSDKEFTRNVEKEYLKRYPS